MNTCCQHQLFLSTGLPLSIYKPSANLEMASEFLYVLCFVLFYFNSFFVLFVMPCDGLDVVPTQP